MAEHPTSTDRGTINVPYVLLLGAAASLGGMLFGFDLGIMAGAGPFLIQQFRLDDLQLGWVYSALLFGCVAGSLLAGRLADVYGRRKLLLSVALLFLLTSIGTAMAQGFLLVVLARVAGGLAVGAVSVASPIYIAEVAPPSMRGRMGAAYQMSITAGILIAYALDYFLRNAHSNWRWMFLSGALPSLVFFLAMFVSPETPRYLIQSSRRREGLGLLSRMMGAKEAGVECIAIETSVKSCEGSRPHLAPRTFRRVLLFSVVLAILVQASGINLIIDYAPIVLKATGWKIGAALASMFAIGGVNFLFTLVSFWTIDRYGRKPLYLVGSAGMGAAMLLAVAVLLATPAQGAWLLGCMVLFIAFFASCIGPVFWTVLPEIFPNQVRASSMMVPVVVQWLANAAVVLAFPVALHHVGMTDIFLFLACMSILQAWFASRYLPETKGRTLEEIEQHWNPNQAGNISITELSV